MKIKVGVYNAKVICPFCGAENTGWICDPRGEECKCDECEKTFNVPIDAEVVLE